MITIKPYTAQYMQAVDRLWKTVFPADPPRNHAANAIPLKLSQDDGLFWVALDENGELIGTIMAGWDGHRGWLYSVAVDPAHQHKGCGSKLVNHALEALRQRGCHKVNLQIRAGNSEVEAFYK